jgi:hypothetical protein
VVRRVRAARAHEIGIGGPAFRGENPVRFLKVEEDAGAEQDADFSKRSRHGRSNLSPIRNDAFDYT